MSTSPQSGPAREVTLEQMRTALHFSPVPTAILQWGTILYINPAGRVLLGAEDAEQCLSQSVLRWTDPKQSEEARKEQIDLWISRGERISIARKPWVRRNGKWTRQDGNPLVLDIKAWTVPLVGGDGIELIFSDSTAQYAAEQSHMAREDYLQLTMDAGAIGTWDLNPATGKLHWSKRCNEVFGLPWDAEIDYVAFLKLLHPDERQRTDAAVQQSCDPDGTGEYSSDYRVVLPNGEIRWVAATGRAFFRKVNGQRQAVRVAGIVLDITGLRKTDASVAQTEKLAVAERLAASIAHEINNPLESITNLLYLVRSGTLDPEQRKYVDLAEQELARVTDIATQTLRFYHDPGAPTQCSIAEIIDSVLTLFHGQIVASNIHVEREYADGATLLGAREELRQVLVNLIRNSMDAMPHGGRLILRTKGTTHPRTGRRGVRIIVADNGHGMARSTMQRLYEPFFTTRSSVGTGLGLWLSAKIVRKHGGTIQVKSCQQSSRTGTVFSIFLPLDRRKESR